MKKYLILITLIALIFNGCAFNNLSKEELKENSKTKVFIDYTDDTKQAYKKLLEFIVYTTNEEYNKNKLDTFIVSDVKDKNFTIDYEYEPNRMDSFWIVDNKYKGFIKNTTSKIYDINDNYVLKKSKISPIPLKIKDNKIVSLKKYKNEWEVIEDFVNINIAFHHNIRKYKEIVKETGFNLFYIDANDIKNKKLILKLINFNLKNRVTQEIQKRGYTIASNFDKADKKILIQDVAFGTNHLVNKNTRAQATYNTSPRFSPQNSTITSLASSNLGHGSGTSAQLGLAVFLVSGLFNNPAFHKVYKYNLYLYDRNYMSSPTILSSNAYKTYLSVNTTLYNNKHKYENIVDLLKNEYSFADINEKVFKVVEKGKFLKEEKSLMNSINPF